MTQTNESKKRTVTLSKKTNEDLEALCESLGVNAHSYVVNEIAKAVQRDSITFKSTTNQKELFDSILGAVNSASK
jgi:hypothetical protein